MCMTAKELNDLFAPLAEKIGWPTFSHEEDEWVLKCDPNIGFWWVDSGNGENYDNGMVGFPEAAALIEQHVAAHLDAQPFLWCTELRDNLWRVLAIQDDGLATVATGKTKLEAMVAAGMRE